MDIHLYVFQGGDDHEVGRVLCPVVPRVGETIHLRMTLDAPGGWQLDPASQYHVTTAFFQVKEVIYDGFNVKSFEDGMRAAQFSEESAMMTVILYVKTKDAHTQAYVDRIVNKGKQP